MDCLVLGGGITGAGVARDAAMRGHRVWLVDSHDFASGTSHLTSKVVHGGLRYLEHGHIRPVVEGIVERYRLLDRIAPNLVHPLKFVLPFEGHRFPKWLATLSGLQLYGLAEWYRCNQPSTPMLGVRLRRDYPAMRPHPFAVTFWDAQTNDARLVMAALRTAEREGAVLRNYTRLSGARFANGAWIVRLTDTSACDPEVGYTIRAKSVVNATGPWSPLTAELIGAEPRPLFWIKGSHILLNRPARFGRDAIVIQSVRDRRPLWVIPWENRLIVGTTESRYEGDLRHVRPTADEVEDLYASFAHYFPGLGIMRGEICGAYAGVRPIIPQEVDSANSLSREHRIEVDAARRLVTVSGGKLTTFRRIAEQAVDQIDALLARDAPQGPLRDRLRHAMLWPDLTLSQSRRFCANLWRLYGGDGINGEVIEHLVRHQGWDSSAILRGAAGRKRLLCPLYEGLPYTLAELAYLSRVERVRHLIDLVKRRTSLYFLAERSGIDSLPRIVKHVAPLLGWNEARQARELSMVADEFRADMAWRGDSAAVPLGDTRETVCA